MNFKAMAFCVLTGSACGAGTDDSAPQAQGECGSAHAKVGQRAALTRRAHGVSGTVEVVDDCTLVVRGFTYDGGGLEVRFYGATAGTDFRNGTNLTRNILGERFNGEDFTIKLPVGVTLDQVDKVSVWCVPAKEEFGSGTFSNAS